MSEQKKNLSERVSTIGSITNPLKFFALSLLIVEGLIGVLSIHASPETFLTLAYLATFMFVLVIFMVVWLLFKAPQWVTAQNATEIVEFQMMVDEKANSFKERNKGMETLTNEHGDLDSILNSPDLIEDVVEIKMERAEK